MVSTEAKGFGRVFKVQLEIHHVLVATMRSLEAAVAVRFDKAGRNLLGLIQTSGKVENFFALSRVDTYGEKTAGSTTGRYETGAILFGMFGVLVNAVHPQTLGARGKARIRTILFQQHL